MSDYDANATNDLRVKSTMVPGSGKTAGVKDGLSSVESIASNPIPVEMLTDGSVFRQKREINPADGNGSGQNFKFSR